MTAAHAIFWSSGEQVCEGFVFFRNSPEGPSSCIVYSKNWGCSQRKVRQRRTFRDDAPQIQALTGHSCCTAAWIGVVFRVGFSRSLSVVACFTSLESNIETRESIRFSSGLKKWVVDGRQQTVRSVANSPDFTADSLPASGTVVFSAIPVNRDQQRFLFTAVYSRCFRMFLK